MAQQLTNEELAHIEIALDEVIDECKTVDGFSLGQITVSSAGMHAACEVLRRQLRNRVQTEST